MLFKEAFLAALSLFICYGGNWLLGQSMLERPIVVGAVTGILLGDVPTGIIIGASLEAIFMGAVNIGGAISAEPASATVFATTFAIVLGIETNAALALAIPIGVLSAFISIFMGSVVLNVFAPMLDKAAANNNQKGIVALHYGMWILKFTVYSAIVFVGVLVGTEPVQQLVNNIPPVIMSGLTACGGLLPAVGFAILMKMLWSKELAIYYFAGFVCVAYLKLPLVAVAVIGIIIAVVSAMRDKEILDITRKSVAVVAGSLENDEEEFFK